MGDVYKAMNRAMRERGQATSSPEAAPAPPSSSPPVERSSDPEAPALPIAEVEAAALAPEEKPVNAPLPPVTPRPAVAPQPPAKPAVVVAAPTVAAPAAPTAAAAATSAAPTVAAPAPTPEVRVVSDRPAITTPTAAAMQRAAAGSAKPAVAATTAPAAPHADQPTEPASPAAAESLRPGGLSLNGYSPEVVVHHDRGSVITEQYRAIRTQILARARNRRLQLHVVTSSAPQEGKSVTTVNLGIAFCELRNQRTLLVEGDLRRPAFHKYFRRKPEPGLLHYLRGKTDDIDAIIHPTVHDNLQVIPAGDREFTSSTELLSSPRMAQLLDRLRDRYEHIFIDTPPVITVTDACILGAMADETLLVVRLNRTPTEVVDRAKRLLRAANCDVAGVILTHMKFHVPNYLYRYV